MKSPLLSTCIKKLTIQISKWDIKDYFYSVFCWTGQHWFTFVYFNFIQDLFFWSFFPPDLNQCVVKGEMEPVALGWQPLEMTREQNLKFPSIHNELIKFNVGVFQLISLKSTIQKHLQKAFLNCKICYRISFIEILTYWRH